METLLGGFTALDRNSVTSPRSSRMIDKIVSSRGDRRISGVVNGGSVFSCV